jgi:hypothetical protein
VIKHLVREFKIKVAPIGIEPILKDYESTVLPLNYGRFVSRLSG